MFQVMNKSNGTGLVIQYHHSAGTQAASGSGYAGEIHFHIEVGIGQEIGGSAAGQYATKAKACFHATSVFLQ